MLKNEKEILDIILSIPVDKWVKHTVTFDSEHGDPVECKLNLNGVFITLYINTLRPRLSIGETDFRSDEINDLINRVNAELKMIKEAKGEQILRDLLDAKQSGFIQW